MGYGPVINGKQKPITQYENSWAATVNKTPINKTPMNKPKEKKNGLDYHVQTQR
jgi:hypothetical protein